MEKKGALYQRFLERMRADKKFEAAVYATLLALGLLLYLLIPEGGFAAGAPQGGATEAGTLEEELAQTLRCMRGVGEVEIMLRYDEGAAGGVGGAIVVAEGARDAAVRKSIEAAVSAILSLDAPRIAVFEMDQTEEVD